jgi:hypothetical protein
VTGAKEITSTNNLNKGKLIGFCGIIYVMDIGREVEIIQLA